MFRASSLPFDFPMIVVAALLQFVQVCLCVSIDVDVLQGLVWNIQLTAKCNVMTVNVIS